MAYQLKAGVVKRDSVYVAKATTLEAEVFNVADMQRAHFGYLKPPTFNQDVSTVQNDGGILAIGDSRVASTDKLVLAFGYNDGSDFRETKILVSCNTADYYTALASTTQFLALSAATSSGWTTVG